MPGAQGRGSMSFSFGLVGGREKDQVRGLKWTDISRCLSSLARVAYIAATTVAVLVRSRGRLSERGSSFGTGNVNHAAVLPQSPPVITSPYLESHLFLTPTPPAKAKMSSYLRSSLTSPEPTPTPTSNEGKRNTRSLSGSLRLWCRVMTWFGV